jgi:hypothetical protein
MVLKTFRWAQRCTIMWPNSCIFCRAELRYKRELTLLYNGGAFIVFWWAWENVRNTITWEYPGPNGEGAYGKRRWVRAKCIENKRWNTCPAWFPPRTQFAIGRGEFWLSPSHEKLRSTWSHIEMSQLAWSAGNWRGMIGFESYRSTPAPKTISMLCLDSFRWKEHIREWLSFRVFWPGRSCACHVVVISPFWLDAELLSGLWINPEVGLRSVMVDLNTFWD